jgi:hypothetical protein
MVAAIVLQMNVHFDRILNLLGQVLAAGSPAMKLTLSRQMGIPYGGSARGTVSEHIAHRALAKRYLAGSPKQLERVVRPTFTIRTTRTCGDSLHSAPSRSP